MRATRLIAAALAFLGIAPLWRLLPARATGLAGAATANMADAYAALIWNGLLIALIPGIIAAMVLDPERFERALARLVAPLARPRLIIYAAGLGVLACVCAYAVARLAAAPTLIDSFAQLTQARYLAAGRLAGPLTAGPEFWNIQQMVITPNGWVSQYPPGYIALLALGLRAGHPELVGPVMFGIAVVFTTLISAEVYADRALARFAALLVALSPFMLGQAAAYMSHVPAAAFSAAALYFVLRGMRGGVRWAVAAGICIGVLFTIRPLTGLVAGVTAIAYVLSTGTPMRTRAARIALALAAAAPFLMIVAFYNAHFFGSATTFGYQAALGPSAGLGFGVDPWGNRYGLLEALAYTSAELVTLSLFLFETPLPLVVLVGLYFALSPQPSRAESLVFWWAMSLVVASTFYWHHGLFMGPRMLADAGPLWALLAVMSTAGLIARIRMDWRLAGKYSARSFAAGGACAALAGGLLFLAPHRLLSYRQDPHDAQLHAPAVTRPSLVFVHSGWTARVAMNLAGHGMRLDSVETALRQNSTCAAHHYAVAYARGERPVVSLDFTPRAINLPRAVQTAPGNRIRVWPGEPMDAECGRELNADTAGVLDVTPYVWQGDLPGLTKKGALFVRDFGPAANEVLLREFPDRVPLMLRTRADGQAELQPYAQAIQTIWGAS